MKKILGIAFFAALLSFSDTSIAQEKQDDSFGQDVKQVGKATGRTVKKGGKKVGEVGAKSAAKVKDKSLKNVKGPNGETVYIDKYQRKYYVNKDAKRIYLK